MRFQLQHVMQQSREDSRSEQDLKSLEEQQDELQACPLARHRRQRLVAGFGRKPSARFGVGLSWLVCCAQARLLLVQQVLRLNTHALLAPLNREPLSPAYLRPGTEQRVPHASRAPGAASDSGFRIQDLQQQVLLCVAVRRGWHRLVAQAERAHPRHICTGLGLPCLRRSSRYNLRWRRTRNDSRGSPVSMCVAASTVSASSAAAAPLLRPPAPSSFEPLGARVSRCRARRPRASARRS